MRRTTDAFKSTVIARDGSGIASGEPERVYVLHGCPHEPIDQLRKLGPGVVRIRPSLQVPGKNPLPHSQPSSFGMSHALQNRRDWVSDTSRCSLKSHSTPKSRRYEPTR